MSRPADVKAVLMHAFNRSPNGNTPVLEILGSEYAHKASEIR